jgi:hypothetical protein
VWPAAGQPDCVCIVNRLPRILATAAKSLTTEPCGEVWAAGHSFEIPDLGLLPIVWRAGGGRVAPAQSVKPQGETR